MIDRIHVRNFKCLRDVDIKLSPFTILIGPNDSGKSSLIEAIQLLGETAQKPWSQVFDPRGGMENLVSMKDKKQTISWEVEGTVGKDRFNYSLRLACGESHPRSEKLEIGGAGMVHIAKNQNGQVMASIVEEKRTNAAPIQAGFSALSVAFHNQQTVLPIKNVVVALNSSLKYNLRPDDLRNRKVPTEGEKLSRSGDNLVGLLDALVSSPDDSLRSEFEKQLREEIPTIRGIGLRPAKQGGEKSLEFRLSGTNGIVTIPAPLASDGLMLLAGYLALTKSETPDLLFIEEPENGLHYSRLKLVVDLLRKMTTGELGNRARQVIVTTHSPLLLNLAKPEEVRVFNRSVENGTEVASMDELPSVAQLGKEFGLGELWFMLGEERLLKGERK